jgi:predicted Zn-dependent protease
LLTVPAARVRALARAGFITPQRGPRGEYHFSFQDIVLLRTASSLQLARVPQSRMHRALGCLKTRLPPGQPLTSYRIDAHGERIVVSDGERTWDIESDQLEIDFPRPRAVIRSLPTQSVTDAEEWYQQGLELEHLSPSAAETAYRRAIELDPKHADAHVNLGRLLHQAGRVSAAAEHYRQALHLEAHATAAFNLGIALEDLGKAGEAAQAYRTAIQLDESLAEAHYNLANLCQRLGDRLSAIRHFKAYRTLTDRSTS